MDELLKRKLVYASVSSLAAMLVIVSIFSISLNNVTVNQANKISNLTHTYYIQSTNLTQTSNKIAQLEANISNLTDKLKILESKSNSFALQENLSKTDIASYQKEVNSLSIKLSQLNNSYNTIKSLYLLSERSLSYSLAKLSAENASIFNLSSVLSLKNQKILNLSSNLSSLKSSLAADNASIYKLSSELTSKNQTIAKLSSELNNESRYIYEDNFIPSKITSMNLNYTNSTIRSIAKNGSNILIVGNETDPGYFAIIYNVNSGKNTNLTANLRNDGIANVFSSTSNGKGFTFLVKFSNNNIGLVEYNKSLENITSFNNYTNFYPTGLSYSSKGYLITGYSKENVQPPHPATPSTVYSLLYYNLSNNSVINLSSKLESLSGYNLTNPVYNGTNYCIVGYKALNGNNPPGTSSFELSLLSYTLSNNSSFNISNLSLDLPVTAAAQMINLSLSWNGAYFLIAGSYAKTSTNTPPVPNPPDHTPNPSPPISTYYNFLEAYNPTTNLWTNVTGKIGSQSMHFTGNTLWNGSSFITALSNSSKSGLYSLNK